MIPRDFITEWRRRAPWVLDAQVEQDLTINRALGEMFSIRIIRENLAFRGGTALYKLYRTFPVRYSEDIDLVQIRPGAIGPIIDALRSVLDNWLGQPKREFADNSVKLQYRFTSEDTPALPLRLKIEINTREHEPLLGLSARPLQIVSRWYSSNLTIPTFFLEELLGTKMRALYQRKKGRDAFDLWYFMRFTSSDADTIVRCFLYYINQEGTSISRANFESNLHEKLNDRSFGKDVEPFLAIGEKWDIHAAVQDILHSLVSRLPGEPWKGAKDDSHQKKEYRKETGMSEERGCP